MDRDSGAFDDINHCKPLVARELVSFSAAYPEVTQQLSENLILTTVDDFHNGVRLSSL